MPDLDIVPLRFCASWWGQFKVKSTNPATPHQMYTVNYYGAYSPTTCSCPGFTHHGECKHIELVHKLGCFWNEQFDAQGLAHIRPQSHNRIDYMAPGLTKKDKPRKTGRHLCPSCGDHIFVVMCGV